MQAIDKREKRTDHFYPNQPINPTGDKPVLIFKSFSPAGYLNRYPIWNVKNYENV
jgi:hypothetical protein